VQELSYLSLFLPGRSYSDRVPVGRRRKKTDVPLYIDRKHLSRFKKKGGLS
jgi:hypothetical protein